MQKELEVQSKRESQDEPRDQQRSAERMLEATELSLWESKHEMLTGTHLGYHTQILNNKDNFILFHSILHTCISI